MARSSSRFATARAHHGDLDWLPSPDARRRPVIRPRLHARDHVVWRRRRCVVRGRTGEHRSPRLASAQRSSVMVIDPDQVMRGRPLPLTSQASKSVPDRRTGAPTSQRRSPSHLVIGRWPTRGPPAPLIVSQATPRMNSRTGLVGRVARDWRLALVLAGGINEGGVNAIDDHTDRLLVLRFDAVDVAFGEGQLSPRVVRVSRPLRDYEPDQAEGEQQPRPRGGSARLNWHHLGGWKARPYAHRRVVPMLEPFDGSHVLHDPIIVAPVAPETEPARFV